MSVLNEEMWQQIQRNIHDGLLQQAEALLQTLLSQSPEDPDTLYLLGIINARQGRQEGLDMINLAIKQHPVTANFPFNPVFLFTAITALANPVDAFRTLLRCDSANTTGYNQLALMLARQGQVQAAINLLTHVLAIHVNAETHNNLGRLLRLQDKLDDALLEANKALALDDNYAAAYLNRASIMRSLGRFEAGIKDIQQALSINPNYTEAKECLAYLLRETGRTDEALNLYQHLAQINPDNLNTLLNLGILCGQANKLDEAASYYQQAIAIEPNNASIRNNLANILKNQQHFEAAAEQYQAALKIRPDFVEAHSNYLFLLSYNVLCSPEVMLSEHRHWDDVHGLEGRRHLFQHQLKQPPAANKKLRIGYVSPDFRTHSVSYFFEPIAQGYNRQSMEVYCYAEVAKPDAVTERIQSLVDGWYSTVGKTDEQIAGQIYQDGIDVLVDLAGHTAKNRLKAFTYQPAPVQLTYMGYFTTTGLQAMGYWITDPTLHPTDTIELSVEQKIHLPRCLVAYSPYSDAPDVKLRDTQDIVFGCFNELSKITPRTIRVWSQILQAIPTSRLLIKARQLSDKNERQRLINSFTEYGIYAKRLILRSLTASLREHMAVYGEVDITLDTMPRTGFTTTTEALWMGVPVITMPGERFIERVSGSMLQAIGMDEWVAESEQDYITKAVALAQDAPTRAALRQTQRARMAASSLCDGEDMALQLELCYRKLIRKKSLENGGE